MNIDTTHPAWAIIDKFYPENENAELRHILITHSQLVAQKALALAARHPELSIDRTFVEQAALLHDIGIFKCNAPAIYCKGTEPYLRHGYIGANLLRKEGLPSSFVRVCERHTGAGLTREDILTQNLPLPPQDFLPETIEEKLICYADKFYSKTHLTQEKSIEQVLKSMERFGNASVQRFLQMKAMFE